MEKFQGEQGRKVSSVDSGASGGVPKSLGRDALRVAKTRSLSNVHHLPGSRP